jgi:hypothetical protein
LISVQGADAATVPHPVPGTVAAPAPARAPARAPANLQAAAATSGLTPFTTVTGKVYMSEDAIGTNDPAGGPVLVQKRDASATVQAAYLLAAGVPDYLIQNGDITLNGTSLSFPAANNVVGNFGVNSVWTDVTSIVKPVVDSAPAGNVSFTAAEPNNTTSIDGEILAVIMSDPTLPTDNTVSFEFGALNTTGDTYSIGLAQPLNLSDPNLALTMSIGDSYGYQGPPATGQYSDISVNGTKMTSSAGGNDDSVCKYDNPQDFANCGNGELITVGGIGDSTANPPDPNATDADCAGGPPRCDDELYNLLPFVHNGDTSIQVNTDNPSNNDNIFFTGFELDSTVAVVGEGATLSPASGTSPVGTPYTLTTKVQDSNGNPIANQAVTFTVLSGPDAGVHGNATTDATGSASFTYSGASPGEDAVQVSFTDPNGNQVVSNTATVDWTAVAQPPVANSQSVTTPQDTPVPITLTGSDPGGHSLTYTVASNPSHGTLSGTAPNLTYTPNAGYTGTDSFTFTVNNGTSDSAPATVSITVTPSSSTCPSTAPTTDGVVSANQTTASATFKSPALTTTSGSDLVLAFVEADGPKSPTQKVTTVTGGGLTWSLAARSNTTWGTTEVWQAFATAPLSAVKVTAKLAFAYDGAITVAAFHGAAPQVGATAVGAGKTGTPMATFTPQACGSLVWAAGHDWSRSASPVAAAGQTLVHRFIDRRVNDSFWTQKVDDPTAANASVTVTTTGPVNDRWTMAAVEIRPAS